jgi:signal transduction histidine kinase
VPWYRIPYRDHGLKVKLAFVMLILFACSLAAVVVPYFLGRESLRHDIEKGFLEFSDALRVSVDQLASPPAENEEARLKKYVESLKKSGIGEVSVLGQDMGVIDSTNPKAIGKHAKLKLPPEKLVINATFGEPPAEGEKGTSRDLVVPVTVGGDVLGYIHVRMQIDDFTEPIRRNLYLRTGVTLLVFSLGMALAVSISSHYVRPVEELARAAERVSAGDLSQELPVTGNDEVGRLTRAFNGMIAGLRRSRELEERIREDQYLAQLGRLASGMAHEIRNPLNFIGLAVDHLSGITVGRGEAEEREKEETIRRIRSEVKRLNDLVTNFVLYGRPTHPQPSLVPLSSLCAGVLSLAEERMRGQGVRAELAVPEGLAVPVDPDMFRRAVVNLVANALDAMPDGGVLRLVGREEGGVCVLEVADTGGGISDENLGKVFEPYFTTKGTGLGLGLVLTRKIVEAHGGTIGVESEEGRGTSIRVTVPLAGEA